MGIVAVELVGGPYDGRTADVETASWGFPPPEVIVEGSDSVYRLDVDAGLARPFRYRMVSAPAGRRVEPDPELIAAYRGVLGEAGVGPLRGVMAQGTALGALTVCLLEMSAVHGGCDGCPTCVELQRALSIVDALDVVWGPPRDDDAWPPFVLDLRRPSAGEP